MQPDDRGTAIALPVRSSESAVTALTHYAHPRCLDKTWCGAEREPNPYQWRDGEQPGCVVCADMREALGGTGWKMGLA